MFQIFISISAVMGQLQVVPSQTPVYTSGVIYLKLVDTTSVVLAYPGNSVSTASPIASLYTIFDQYRVSTVHRPFMALPTQKLSRIYKVSFTSGNVFDFIAACAQNQLVEFAEQVPFDEVMIEPNDPSYPNGSYQLPLINAAAAFDIHQGGTTIAIVDDAVLTTHEDLAANIDNGWDVADNDPNTNPPLIGSNAATPNSFSHGTHVSGIAGGVTDNGIGIASIGWNNRILPIKATRDDIPNGRQITHGYEGLAFAASQGARIINNSWGGTAPSQANYLVVQAANDAGSIIVAAAGNANTTLPMYPAAYGEGTTGSAWEATNRSLVIAVASVDADGARSIWPGVLGNGGSNFWPMG